MKAKFNKLFTLLTILTLGFGQLWAVETTKTYNFDDDVALATDWDVTTDVPSGGTAVCEITNSLSGAGFSVQDGKYLGLAYKNKSNIGIDVVSTASYNSISEVSLKVVAGDNSKPTFAIYIVTSSGDEEILAAIGSKDGFSTGGSNKWGSKTITVSPAKTGKIKIVTIASSSGKYAAIDDISVTYTATPSCSTEITTQPSGATLAVGDANPELSIVATHADSYAWKESSDGTSKDGAVTLGTNATFTPEVNDAVQTKYYYCEVTSDCDGSTVVSSNIVTVNVVGSITYYTVTLNPAGGTIVDATGWTLNAGNYEKEVAEGTELTLPTFTKENRNFKTWRNTSSVDVASPVTVNSDLTLTAIWTATVENVIYSWEGAEGGAIETGGTVTGSADNLINQPSAGYYCLKIDGNNSYSGNLVTITLAGTEKVKTGDKIKYWGFYNKSSNANARPKMRDANSPNASIFDDPNNLPNLYSGGDPAERTFTVPADINTNAVQLTRSQTGSNTWISKLQIIREVQVEEGDLLTVTFNSNGGSSIAPVMVASGQTVAKPADPTKAHNRFNEWQLSGSAYNFATPVTSNITLDADWTQLYTISFANGGGSGDAPAAIADKAQGETFQVPANTFTAPSASQEFDIWNDGTNDYAPGATYTVGTENVILTAQWKALVAKYTVIFKDGETTLDTKLVDVGSNPSDAGVDKTKALFTFAAWQKDDADIALDDASWTSVAANAEVTLTARWTKVYAETADLAAEAAGDKTAIATFLSGKGYAATIGGSGGYDTNASGYLGYKFKNNGDEIQFNLQNGKIADIAFMYIETNFKVYVDGVETYTVTNKTTSATPLVKYVYANGADKLVRIVNGSANSKTSVINKIAIHDPYVVTYDATTNGGEALDPGTATFTGTALTLPAAVKGTDDFIGWYDAATSGTKIGEADDEYTPSATITLYAHFESISTDARLASITLDPSTGTLSPAFDPEVVNYTYTMPYGTAAIPTITGATAVNANAKEPVIVQQASAWNETAIIRGVAQSDDTKAYNITMKIAPKDGVSIIKVETTGGTNKTVTGLYAGDGDVNLSSSKKMDGGKYIGFTLNGTALQAGDQINVHTTQASSTGGSHIIFYDNMTDKNELYETGEIGGLGDNIFTINAAMVGQVSAYVYRSNADAAHQWNGYVDFIEVTRAINPMLTAITINGQAGVIDESLKTVAVELQPGYDLAALTIVPTIVSNTDEALVVKTVTSNEGNWVLGPNTYRLTDKDGDYTEYTITLTAGALKHNVTFNTHGGSAVAGVEVVDGEYLTAGQVPANPTKEDYIFQYWSETEDGSEVDITTVQINADKEFHAVWASDGAIKLLDGATVNHTNFITGVTADETVEFKGNTVNYAKFSGAVSGVNGVKDLDRVIAYNATTTQTKIRISVHNNSTNARSLLVKGVVEGSTDVVNLATIDLTNKEDKVSDWITFDNAANRTIYIFVSSNAGDVYFTQVKVIETGTALPMFGQAGYSMNLNKGRIFGRAPGAISNFEGMHVESLGSDYQPTSSTVGRFALGTSISFDVTSDVTMSLTAANNKTYYVTKDAAGTDNETSVAGVSEFALTAGTWYITAGAEDMQFTNIAFSAPKCAEPAITPMSNSDLCEGDAFAPLTVSATVSDGGTLHYAWFKEAGATDEAVGTDAASYTPAADGEYYVIVTNQKDGFGDNSKTSNTITVEHFAAAVITTAPLNQRGSVDAVVTLSVAATGKNLSYKWYTCDDEAGNNEVAIDPAETGTSLNVTITAAMAQWYKVKVTSDCGNAEATAKVEEFVPATPANVTETTTWDWTSTAWPASGSVTFSDPAADGTDVTPDYELLANTNSIVPNNDGFRSDMLYGKGQYVWRSGNKFFQGTALKFTTTVAGRVRVYFRSTGENKHIQVKINGTEAGIYETGGFRWSSYVYVPAGDVEIICKATDENKAFTRIQKIEFQTPDYTRTAMLGNGVLGTLCVDHNVPVEGIQGATFYELVGRNTEGKIAFDQITTGQLDAGKPYVFQANGDKLALYYGTETEADPVNGNGMYGTFTDLVLTELDDVYYFAQKALWSCTDLTSLSIPANRAYVKLSELPDASPAPAPGRIRMTLNVNGAPAVVTGVENLENNEAPVKMLINGQLFILRGEKMYDATGRLVK